MVPKRLERLEVVEVAGCSRAFVAATPLARLLGLAFLDDLPTDCGLLIPRCRSVHTLGMRFALDVYFLDERGRALEVRHGVGPGRAVWRRDAAAVLERPARPERRPAVPA